MQDKSVLLKGVRAGGGGAGRRETGRGRSWRKIFENFRANWTADDSGKITKEKTF